ncbi:hypothetical protein ES703_87817 [subsurface metagenome]
MKNKLKQAISKAGKNLWKMFPIILGTILLVSLISTLIPQSFYSKIFTGNNFFDPFIGSLIGSISAGTPLVSYILGGELLKQGIGLLAVTAFLVAWVTVGIIQLPAEMMILGKKFALLRNLVSFVFAIIVAIITILIFNLI